MKRVDFNSELYSRQILLLSAQAYKDIADISISDYETGYSVVFQNCKYGEEQTALEFGNYVIDLMNQPHGNN